MHRNRKKHLLSATGITWGMAVFVLALLSLPSSTFAVTCSNISSMLPVDVYTAGVEISAITRQNSDGTCSVISYNTDSSAVCVGYALDTMPEGSFDGASSVAAEHIHPLDAFIIFGMDQAEREAVCSGTRIVPSAQPSGLDWTMPYLVGPDMPSTLTVHDPGGTWTYGIANWNDPAVKAYAQYLTNGDDTLFNNLPADKRAALDDIVEKTKTSPRPVSSVASERNARIEELKQHASEVGLVLNYTPNEYFNSTVRPPSTLCNPSPDSDVPIDQASCLAQPGTAGMLGTDGGDDGTGGGSLLSGLVPCGNVKVVSKSGGGYTYTGECTICHLQVLGQRILSFLILISVALAALLFAYAGWLYVSSPGNPGNVSRGHRVFTNTLIGFVLILAAYLLIDTILKATLRNEGGEGSVYTGEGATKYGPWNEILCAGGVEQYESHDVTAVKPVTLVGEDRPATTQAELDAFFAAQQAARGGTVSGGVSSISGPCDDVLGGSGCLGQLANGKYIRPEDEVLGVGTLCIPNCANATTMVYDAYAAQTYFAGCLGQDNLTYEEIVACRNTTSIKAGVTYVLRVAPSTGSVKIDGVSQAISSDSSNYTLAVTDHLILNDAFQQTAIPGVPERCIINSGYTVSFYSPDSEFYEYGCTITPRYVEWKTNTSACGFNGVTCRGTVTITGSDITPETIAAWIAAAPAPSTPACDPSTGGPGCLGQLKSTGKYITASEEKPWIGTLCIPNCTRPTTLVYDWYGDAHMIYPGCLGSDVSSYSERAATCSYTGSFLPGITYAHRITFKTLSSGNVSPGHIDFHPSETGSELFSYDFSISDTPGDLRPADSHCWRANSNGFIYPALAPTGYSCVVTLDKTYYANYRPAGYAAAACGTSLICRIAIISL